MISGSKIHVPLLHQSKGLNNSNLTAGDIGSSPLSEGILQVLGTWRWGLRMNCLSQTASSRVNWNKEQIGIESGALEEHVCRQNIENAREQETHN